MRSNKAISIITATLVLIANFVSLCDAGRDNSSKVHFIAQSCDNHKCNDSRESHSCALEKCDHEICSDQSVLGEYISKASIQLETIVSPLPVLIIEYLFFSSKQSDLLISIAWSPPDPVQHSTVLRI